MFSCLNNKRGDGNFSTVIKTVILVIVGSLVMFGLSFLVTKTIDSSNDKYKNGFNNLKNPNNIEANAESIRPGGLYNTKELVVSWDDIKVSYAEYKKLNTECNDMQFELNKIKYINNEVFKKFSSSLCNELVIDNSITTMGDLSENLVYNISDTLPYLNTISFSNNTENINGIIYDDNNVVKTLNFGSRLKNLNCEIKIKGLQKINYTGTVEDFKRINGCKNVPVNVYCSDGVFKPNGAIKSFELNYIWKSDISSNQDGSLYAYCVQTKDAVDDLDDKYTVYIYGKGGISVNKNFTVEYKDGTNVESSMFPWADNSISTWDSYSFHITNIKIYNGPTYIPNEMFAYTTYLEKVVLPKSITQIGGEIFKESYIKSITISENVSELEVNAFNYAHLEEILVDENNKAFYSKDGVLFSSDMETLIKVPQEFVGDSGYYNIPNTVETIYSYAFQGNQLIEGLNISDSVRKISATAFDDTWLYDNYRPNGNDFIIGNWLIKAFEYENNEYRVSGCEGVDGPEINYIAEGAFIDCDNIQSIFLPKTLFTPLDFSAFTGADYLNIIYYEGSSTGLYYLTNGLSVEECENTLNGIEIICLDL